MEMNVSILIDSMKKIPNQGMISMETHHTGDLIIQFDVEFPPINFFHNPNIIQVFTNNIFKIISLFHFEFVFYFSIIAIRNYITT